MSLIEESNTAEWATRKISIIGAAKSFISQLSVGQDLTRVSLPAVFLYPYSALEMVGVRFLQNFDMMLNCNEESDSVQRLLTVVKWFLCVTQKEKLDKKPYNPLLGETHFCWNSSDSHGNTRYIAEQVSHHPPVSAISVVNEKEKVELLCNLIFSIKFFGNSVTVKADSSPLVITLHPLFSQNNNDSGDNDSNAEQYTATLPNIGIKNVILGTKRIAWEGTTVIKCEKTGLQCTLTFKEEGWYCYNTVNAVISTIQNPESPIKVISGNLGEVINITDPTTQQSQVFIDIPRTSKLTTQYLPPNERDNRNSLSIWSEVTQAVVVDDMHTADMEKLKVENAQRKRRAENSNWNIRYFTLNQNNNLWEPNKEALQQVHTNTAPFASNFNTGVVDGESKPTAIASIPDETKQ